MLNKAMIIGNLGHDPQIRQTQNGLSVGNFSVATSEKWTDKQGEKQESTEWHKVIVWDKLADNCGKFIGKGSKVYVEGKLTTRKWQDREGNDRWSTEIVARDVKFLTFKETDEQEQSPHGNPHAAAYDPGAPDISDDDIPF